MPDTPPLKGRAAVVTGSTSGIGQAMAHALAAAGADVVLNGFGEATQIERDRAELAEAAGVRVLYHPADMTKPEEIADLIAFAHAKFRRLDILVNNAGVQHVSPIEDFPVEKWDQIIAINLTRAFHAMRAAVPFMKAQGAGRIVNIASAHGLVASPFKGAYVAAKHGILGLTKTVALEVALSGVTCNAICPGYVKTPLVEAQIADQAKARKHGAGCGDARRDPRRAADQAVRRVQRAGRHAALSGQRPGRLGQRGGAFHRWRLDGAIAGLDRSRRRRAIVVGRQGRRGRMAKAVFDQVNLIVRNMDETLAFYRRLGVDIPDTAIWKTPSGIHHVSIKSSADFDFAFDSQRWPGATTRASPPSAARCSSAFACQAARRWTRPTPT